ncbi:histidine phosphatase family protein [Actinoplanes sp. NPDC049118]|uniref:histidine phosphatase family protein n=1 Tax=Actinoplanes sp. NPDC049118 TaxID=3155769 RepID=UPI0033DE71F6
MARLLLVRHGQASFGADDYDALSERGAEQARVLGGSFAQRGIRPDVLLCGSLRRHRETVAGLRDGLGGAPIPVLADPGWDEFDFQHVVEIHRPAYRDRAYLMAELARTDHPGRAFQEIFEAATARWCSSGDDAEYIESFPAFRARIVAVLDRARELLRQHRDIIAVSSGGPIAMAVALLTAGPQADPATLATTWTALNRVAVNTGVTKLVAGRQGLWMSTYNEHTHLEADPRLLTYR